MQEIQNKVAKDKDKMETDARWQELKAQNEALKLAVRLRPAHSPWSCLMHASQCIAGIFAGLQ